MTDEKSMMFMKIVGKATLAPDISGVGGCGGTCSFFSEEKKEPKKSRLAVLPQDLLSSGALGGLYIGSNSGFLSPLIRS